jgi:hypothetical protein
MIKIILSCRSSIGGPVCFVCGRLFSAWRITIYLWKYVHDCRLQRGILFLNMDNRIIFGLLHHQILRGFAIALDWYVFRLIAFSSRLLNGCVHLSYTEIECIWLNLLSNKLYYKKWRFHSHSAIPSLWSDAACAPASINNSAIQETVRVAVSKWPGLKESRSRS